MRIITDPTIVVGGECDEIIAAMSACSAYKHVDEAKTALQMVLQQAFEAGVEFGESKQTAPAPVVASTHVGGGKVPPYRNDWEAINEDGPENKVEEFIYRQAPHQDGEGVNIETWKKQLHEALKYVARQ